MRWLDTTDYGYYSNWKDGYPSNETHTATADANNNDDSNSCVFATMDLSSDDSDHTTNNGEWQNSLCSMTLPCYICQAGNPTAMPTLAPTNIPSAAPDTGIPTTDPTDQPTESPTVDDGSGQNNNDNNNNGNGSDTDSTTLVIVSVSLFVVFSCAIMGICVRLSHDKDEQIEQQTVVEQQLLEMKEVAAQQEEMMAAMRVDQRQKKDGLIDAPMMQVKHSESSVEMTGDASLAGGVVDLETGGMDVALPMEAMADIDGDSGRERTGT